MLIVMSLRDLSVAPTAQPNPPSWTAVPFQTCATRSNKLRLSQKVVSKGLNMLFSRDQLSCRPKEMITIMIIIIKNMAHSNGPLSTLGKKTLTRIFRLFAQIKKQFFSTLSYRSTTLKINIFTLFPKCVKWKSSFLWKTLFFTTTLDISYVDLSLISRAALHLRVNMHLLLFNRSQLPSGWRTEDETDPGWRLTLIPRPLPPSRVLATSVARSVPRLARVRLGSESVLVPHHRLHHGACRREVIHCVVLCLQTGRNGLRTGAHEDIKTSKAKWSLTGCFKGGICTSWQCAFAWKESGWSASWLLLLDFFFFLSPRWSQIKQQLW